MGKFVLYCFQSSPELFSSPPLMGHHMMSIYLKQCTVFSTAVCHYAILQLVVPVEGVSQLERFWLSMGKSH